MKNYLNFELDIKDLENELEGLKDPYNKDGLSEVDTNKISKLQNEIDQKLEQIYSNLNPWQKTLVARHEDRPKSKFFIENLFDEFIPLSGDRYYSEDKSVITGFAKFSNQSVLVIGQEKGDDLDSRIERNFGMMRPEGYRKTIRLMKLADKFNIPIVIFVDTPGIGYTSGDTATLFPTDPDRGIFDPDGGGGEGTGIGVTVPLVVTPGNGSVIDVVLPNDFGNFETPSKPFNSAFFNE